MNLTEFQRHWLIRRAMQSAPQEACGFVMSDGALVEIRNVADNPNRGFKMDSHQMVQKLRENTAPISGIWHTHPSGTLTPSPEDIRAITIGAIGPEWLYIIATASDVSVYYASHYTPLDQQGWSKFAK